ncbi:hypothetical protein [Photobacterium jeanii]|nr:hypothetical protein [Photobacterium jeanii]
MFNSLDWSSTTFTCSSFVVSMTFLPKSDYWKKLKQKMVTKKRTIVLAENSGIETNTEELFVIFEELVLEKEINLVIEHKGIHVLCKYGNKEESLSKKNAILKQAKRWEQDLEVLKSCLNIMAFLYRKTYIHIDKEQVFVTMQKIVKELYAHEYQHNRSICLYRNSYSGESIIVQLDSGKFDEMLTYLAETHKLDGSLAYNALMMPAFYTVSDLPIDFVRDNFLAPHVMKIVELDLGEESMHLNSWYIGLQ